MVYDITNRDSFNNVYRWVEKCRPHTITNTKMVGMLVGNKCDLEDKRQVSIAEGAQRAKRLKLMFQETSALNELSIDIMFKKFLTGIYRKSH